MQSERYFVKWKNANTITVFPLIQQYVRRWG